MSELAIPGADMAEAGPPLAGLCKGVPASGGCLGCLTVQAPSNLRFSEFLDHM